MVQGRSKAEMMHVDMKSGGTRGKASIDLICQFLAALPPHSPQVTQTLDHHVEREVARAVLLQHTLLIGKYPFSFEFVSRTSSFHGYQIPGPIEWRHRCFMVTKYIPRGFLHPLSAEV